ncbi:MAG: ABC transporter ATP-binding protein [Alphaproteobacteria bacterium]|nr:ABC transporter ATP-binding protein [Alphaproteobacteria bacterium]
MVAIPALAVEDLSVEFRTRSGVVKVLDHVGFTVEKGETVALVGESGSGKSVTAFAVMGILDAAGKVTSGRAMFGGSDLLAQSERDLAELRGRELSMIFQNPRTALNPIRRVGQQIADVLVRHGGATRPDAPREAIKMLKKVRIPDPERRAEAYPFELSGGMCQRIMIAIALACRPALLIADEDLIGELGRDSGMATIFITHDLGLAAEYCDRIVVMHAGHIVESAPSRALFANARHPYSAKLLAATPGETASLASLVSIPGGLPDLRRADLPACRYSGRCERLTDACAQPLPHKTVGERHDVACWNPL